MGGLNLGQETEGPGPVCAADAAPEINHGISAADDGFQGGFGIGHHLADGGADEADMLAQFAPIGVSVTVAEHGDSAAGGHEIAGERAEEGGLAGAVRAENGPVLPALDAPGNAVENDGAPALDAEVRDFED